MMLVARRGTLRKKQGIKLCKPEELVSEAEREAWMNARRTNTAASITAATNRNRRRRRHRSDGETYLPHFLPAGTCCKLPGRSRFPSDRLRCYADSEAGGVACTGLRRSHHEGRPGQNGRRSSTPARHLCGLTAASSCDVSTADMAAREAVHLFAKRTHATGGLILLDSHATPASPSTPPACPTLRRPRRQLRHRR